jgi:arsenate reductase (thioredoxin)
MTNILTLCTGNSCRSQIAHGYLKYFTSDKLVSVYSAGVETHGVNPKAIEVMAADGIDISNHTSNNVSEYLHINFDYVITVCDNAQESCPVFSSNAKMLHHSFSDPAKATGTPEEVMAQFVRVRNEIKQYCEEFANTL